MDFACELMDLCRGTQEVEAVLGEGAEDNGARDPLARLKMAVEYEEKKVQSDLWLVFPLSMVGIFFTFYIWLVFYFLYLLSMVEIFFAFYLWLVQF